MKTIQNILSLKTDLEKSLFQIGEQNYDTFEFDSGSGIFTGECGISLFYYFLYLYIGDKRYLNTSAIFFERGFNRLNNKDLTLTSGVVGIMWLLQFYNKEKVFNTGFNSEELLYAFDKRIYDLIDSFGSDLDQMYGLIGLGTYFFNRENDISVKGLNEIFNIVKKQKIEFKEGIAWRSSDYIDLKNKIFINFGYAHGFLGILYFLGYLYKRRIHGEECKEMIEKGLNFFLSFHNNTDNTWFPNTIDFETMSISKDTRVSYCYGDLGIAAGLVSIGKIINDRSILDFAKKIALNIANISIRNINKVNDIGLCHGASGNGYIFFKLYKEFNCPELIEASTLQFRKLLSLRIEGCGIAGYCARAYDNEKESFYKKTDYSFIEGTSGIGLAIISYLGDLKYNHWDKLLYLT